MKLHDRFPLSISVVMVAVTIYIGSTLHDYAYATYLAAVVLLCRAVWMDAGAV